jgi:hypothetical protein
LVERNRTRREEEEEDSKASDELSIVGFDVEKNDEHNRLRFYLVQVSDSTMRQSQQSMVSMLDHHVLSTCND